MNDVNFDHLFDPLDVEHDDYCGCEECHGDHLQYGDVWKQIENPNYPCCMDWWDKNKEEYEGTMCMTNSKPEGEKPLQETERELRALLSDSNSGWEGFFKWIPGNIPKDQKDNK